MPSPLANSSGNGVLLVTCSITGAYNSGAQQKIDVALGKPMLEAIADLANAFHIRKTSLTGTTGRYAVAIRGPDSSVADLKLSFLQAGINEGDSIILEPA